MEDTFISILINTLAASLAAFLGIIVKTLYDISQLKIRLRHMGNIFGDINRLDGSVSVVVPTFQPLSYSNLTDCEKTTVKKEIIACENGVLTEKIEFPLFCDVIALDDYKAFQKINELFMLFGYASMSFKGDIEALKQWKNKLMICIGGPKTNQKMRQILNDKSMQFFDLHVTEGQMYNWGLKVTHDGEEDLFLAQEDISYAYIFKITNPKNPKGRILGIAGDSAYGTEVAARYLCDNLADISSRFKTHNFCIILKSDRGNYDTAVTELEFSLDPENH